LRLAREESNSSDYFIRLHVLFQLRINRKNDGVKKKNISRSYVLKCG
jgi:hypothetical protein